MSTKKKYTLNSIRQLVDLNGDSTNFKIDFVCQSTDGSDFDGLVVDQTTLDNNPDLEYRQSVNGQISGSIVQNKNVYQNFFLILKSVKDCECVVDINKQEIPPDPQYTSSVLPASSTVTTQLPHLKDEETSFSWKWVFIVGGVVVVAVVVYFTFFNKKSESEGESSEESDKNVDTVKTEKLSLPPSSLTPYTLPKPTKSFAERYPALARYNRPIDSQVSTDVFKPPSRPLPVNTKTGPTSPVLSSHRSSHRSSHSRSSLSSSSSSAESAKSSRSPVGNPLVSKLKQLAAV